MPRMGEAGENDRHHDHQQDERQPGGGSEGFERAAFKIDQSPEEDQRHSKEGCPSHGLPQRRDDGGWPAEMGGGDAMGLDKLAEELKWQNHRSDRAHRGADGRVDRGGGAESGEQLRQNPQAEPGRHCGQGRKSDRLQRGLHPQGAAAAG